MVDIRVNMLQIFASLLHPRDMPPKLLVRKTFDTRDLHVYGSIITILLDSIVHQVNPSILISIIVQLRGRGGGGTPEKFIPMDYEQSYK